MTDWLARPRMHRFSTDDWPRVGMLRFRLRIWLISAEMWVLRLRRRATR